MAEVLALKIGLVENVTFADGTTLESAIRKQPVDKITVHELGAEGNDVGLKAHHGGVDKALFFMAEKTFEKLTALIGKDFDWKNTAIYGENFIVSELDETNVCVGDRYQIGVCKKGDKIHRLQRPYPDLNIMHLNQLAAQKPTEAMRAELEKALACEVLAEAFKRTLRNQLSRI